MVRRKIVQREWTAEKSALWESLFTVANGHFGLRGADEERRHTAFPGTLVNGFYEKKPISYGEWAYGYAKNHQTILNVADVTGIELEVDGLPLDFSSGNLAAYVRIFDLEAGTLTRDLQWTSPSGAAVRVESSRLASFARSDIAAIKYTVTALSGCSIEITSLLDCSVRNRASEEGDPRVGTHLEKNPILREHLEARQPGLLLAAGRTKQSGLGVAVAVVNKTPQGLSTSFSVDGEVLSQSWKFELSAGEAFTLEKYVAIADGPVFCFPRAHRETKTGPSEPRAGEATGTEWEAGYGAGHDVEGATDLSTLCERATARAFVAAGDGYDTIAREQAVHLSHFWDRAGIEVDGDESAEEGLMFNVFHIYQSAGRDGATNLAAKGLTGEGYEGHYFWDTEIFALPFFTYEDPALAKSLIDYRISKLDKARARAAELSLPGALFPWRTIDGEEASAYYPAGTAQYHIDADIAYALSLYVSSSGDQAILKTGGAELLFETARLWMGLGFFNPRRGGAFCIPCVTGPDEYTALVDNNAYTNLMAEFNLRKAAEVAAQLAATAPLEYKTIADRLELTGPEIDSWSAAANRMYLPRDKELGIIAQDDAFLDRPAWDLASTPRDNFPLLLHYHPLMIYRHRVLKQPDTVLALFLRHERFSLAEKIRNFNFYEPLTTGDSSLSHGIQSVMASECGCGEKAFEYFRKTARMDLDDVHANTRDGVHIAAMAESWIAVVYGFAGMREKAEGLSFSPHLPASWSRLAFSVGYRTSRLYCEYRHDSSTYRLLEGPAIGFTHENTAVILRPGEESAVTIDETPRPRAWIFDLDGVIADTAVLHYKAWKKLADELGIAADASLRDKVRGVPRNSALLLVLGDRAGEFSPAELDALAEKKNGYYRELLKGITPADILPGISTLLERLRAGGAKIALASASRNSGEVVARLGLAKNFDAAVDPEKIARGKPDPEIFLRAAELLGARHQDCLVLEDAEVGVTAAKAAGMFAVGIGESLGAKADICFARTADATKEAIETAFAAHGIAAYAAADGATKGSVTARA